MPLEWLLRPENWLLLSLMSKFCFWNMHTMENGRLKLWCEMTGRHSWKWLLEEESMKMHSQRTRCRLNSSALSVTRPSMTQSLCLAANETFVVTVRRFIYSWNCIYWFWNSHGTRIKGITYSILENPDVSMRFKCPSCKRGQTLEGLRSNPGLRNAIARQSQGGVKQVEQTSFLTKHALWLI